MDVNKELDELFDDPLLEVTGSEANLFDIPADMKKILDKRREQPDHYAKRIQCPDFDYYAPLFKEVHQQLKKGQRSLLRMGKSSSLKAGEYFVVSGQLVLLESIGTEVKSSNGMRDARTRCIYEDGTESDILLQTLRKNILNDGFGVTPLQQSVDNHIVDTLSEGDIPTGYIYVLRSLSPNPEIAQVKDLYKIGFTTNEVEDRIANAAHEPTYLMAPVHIVETFKVANINSHVLETLVHQVFHQVNFKVKVYDDKGEEYEPSEWYVVPLGIIDKVIERIIDRTIVDYVYNPQMQSLEKHLVRQTSTFDTRGLKVLKLTIGNYDLQQILKGEKVSDKRNITQTSLTKFTYIDEADGKRYLRRYDAIRFVSGRGSHEETVLAQVNSITFEAPKTVVYGIGLILEHTGNLKD